MKCILLITSLLFLVASCSSDHPSSPDWEKPKGPDKPGISDLIGLKINASVKEANIFDNVQFTLSFDKNCNMYDIRQNYDSLVWIVPELNGVFNVMRTSEFNLSWGQSFLSEGKFLTILQGFKDNKMVLADSVTINIKNKRDILGYYWKDITENQNMIYGTPNILDSYYGIYTRKIYEDATPALEVYFSLNYKGHIPDNIIRPFYEKEQEKIAYDYITKLYGNPKLSYEKDASIVEIYKKTFKQPIGKILLPRYIWRTKTSNIVLLQDYDKWGEWHTYFVLAEPNK